ncbi:MAG: hypothetical protein ACK4UQ_00920 [Brevundimonas sp.]
MKARIAFMLLALPLLAGAAPAASQHDASQYERGQQPSPYSDWVECDQRGGEMRRVGFLQMFSCVVPYADAGRACRNDSGCEGQCLAKPGRRYVIGQAVVGACQKDSDGHGCRTSVDGGRVVDQICIG